MTEASDSRWAERVMWSSVEALGPEDVQRLQLGLLIDQVAWLQEHSSFYRNLWDRVGFDVNDFQGPNSMSHAPFTEKDELRADQVAHGGLGTYAAVPVVEVIRVHSSSGTTGRPSFLGVTRSDAAQWTESLARVFWCLGVRPDDIFLHATGLNFFVGGLPVKDAIETIGATFVPIGTGASDRLVQAADSLGGTVLFCTPSYAQYLATYMQEKLQRDPSSLGLRRVLLGAEPGGGIPTIRDRIRALFGCEVREAYGNSDLLPAFAATCDAQAGNHILAPDLLYLELIDPESGEPLPWVTGAMGELVGTSLGRECNAVFRFRSRDHVVVNADPCSCGRTGPRILCIGRTDDMLIVSGVNVWPSAVADVVARFIPQVSGAIKIRVEGQGTAVAPPLHVRVELATDQSDEALADAIGNLIRERLQVKARVELVPPKSLPMSEMKTSLLERV